MSTALARRLCSHNELAIAESDKYALYITLYASLFYFLYFSIQVFL